MGDLEYSTLALETLEIKILSYANRVYKEEIQRLHNKVELQECHIQSLEKQLQAKVKIDGSKISREISPDTITNSPSSSSSSSLPGNYRELLSAVGGKFSEMSERIASMEIDLSQLDLTGKNSLKPPKSGGCSRDQQIFPSSSSSSSSSSPKLEKRVEILESQMDRLSQDLKKLMAKYYRLISMIFIASRTNFNSPNAPSTSTDPPQNNFLSVFCDLFLKDMKKKHSWEKSGEVEKDSLAGKVGIIPDKRRQNSELLPTSENNGGSQTDTADEFDSLESFHRHSCLCEDCQRNPSGDHPENPKSISSIPQKYPDDTQKFSEESESISLTFPSPAKNKSHSCKIVNCCLIIDPPEDGLKALHNQNWKNEQGLNNSPENLLVSFDESIAYSKEVSSSDSCLGSFKGQIDTIMDADPSLLDGSLGSSSCGSSSPSKKGRKRNKNRRNKGKVSQPSHNDESSINVSSSVFGSPPKNVFIEPETSTECSPPEISRAAREDDALSFSDWFF